MHYILLALTDLDKNMQGFKNILIPTDFSPDAPAAIMKALELIDKEEGVISIVHVLRPLFSLFASAGYIVAPVSAILTTREIEEKFEEYQAIIKEKLNHVQVNAIVLKQGSVQKNIIQAARNLKPDLIIIMKGGNKQRLTFLTTIFPPAIARKTGCPVLTIKPGGISTGVKNIVLPIAERVPERKLALAVKLAKKLSAHIHLVTFPRRRPLENGPHEAFIESFIKIKEEVPLMVRYGPLRGNSLAKAALSYAEFIKADMILTNTANESSFRTLSGKRHLSDLLLKDSNIHILDIEPYL